MKKNNPRKLERLSPIDPAFFSNDRVIGEISEILILIREEVGNLSSLSEIRGCFGIEGIRFALVIFVGTLVVLEKSGGDD